MPANSVQRNGLCTTAGTTSFLLVSGTGLAVNQAVVITRLNVSPATRWTGKLEYVNPAGTVGLAVMAVSPLPQPMPPVAPGPMSPGGPAAAAAASGVVGLPTGLPQCSVAIDGGVVTTLNIDLYT